MCPDAVFLIEKVKKYFLKNFQNTTEPVSFQVLY